MNKKWIVAGSLILTLATAALFQYFGFSPESKPTPIPTEELVVEDVNEDVFLYGINVTDLNIVEGTVSKNQTLATILAPFNVPYQIIDEIAKKSKEVFDVRGIATNKKFTVLTPADSTIAQFFIYEPNPVEYVVFNLDSKDIYKAEKPIEFVKREVAGVIRKHSNLSDEMTNQQVSYDIVDQFADLYGWSVDFGALQEGDKFKVVFEEKIIEGNVVGVGDIKLAYFEHRGEPFHAIPFEQNGEMNFFDQEGNSLKKAFLRDPVKYTRISSRYSKRRFHPVQKRYKAHLGTDYAARRGTEIRSVGDGLVTHASYTGGNGNYVKIKHNGTYTTQYLHMSKIASGIKPGTRIKQGQVIGYVGSTGLATGPHLCFRFWKNGKQEDWLREKIPPSEPILAANKAAFESTKFESLQLLAKINYPGEEPKLVAKVEKNPNAATLKAKTD